MLSTEWDAREIRSAPLQLWNGDGYGKKSPPCENNETDFCSENMLLDLGYTDNVILRDEPYKLKVFWTVWMIAAIDLGRFLHVSVAQCLFRKGLGQSRILFLRRRRRGRKASVDSYISLHIGLSSSIQCSIGTYRCETFVALVQAFGYRTKVDFPWHRQDRAWQRMN